MRSFLKLIIFLLFTAGVAYGLYHTSFGKGFIDARVQELKDQGTSSGNILTDSIYNTTGTIVDPGTPGDPLQVTTPSTILGKRLEYYRVSKQELGVKE